MKLLLKVAYNGLFYHGLVSQPNQVTIYSKLKSVCQKLEIPFENVECAGRTDAGVHAANMIISLTIFQKKNYDIMFNNLLPSDIYIKEYAYIDDSFSARHKCKKRKYRYYFITNNIYIWIYFCEEMKKKFLSGEWSMKMFCTKTVEKTFYKKKKSNSLLLNQQNNALISNINQKKIQLTNNNSELKIKFEPSGANINQKSQLESYDCNYKNESNNQILNEILIYKNKNLFQHDDEFDQNFYNRPLQSLQIIDTKSNICYMEISSQSFLHNQIRRMFFCLEKNVQLNYNNGKIQFYEGVAKPENLVFMQAEYNDNIEWISNKKRDINALILKEKINRTIFFENDL